MTTPDDPQRKPGFFSRLFTARKVDAAEEKALSDLPPDDEPIPSPTELEVPRLGPEGFNELPTAPPADAPAPEKKKSLFERFFGSRDAAPPAPPAPATPAPAAPTPAPAERKPSWYERLRDRLRRTTGSFVDAFRNVLGLSGKLDAETVEQLEEILIAADVGMETSMKIVRRMEQRARAEKIEGTEPLMKLFRETLVEVFAGNMKPFAPAPRTQDGPYVIMVVGVNGVGKTTTIGKMAKRCRSAGLNVMLVAGDTFRAAAIEQLEIWSKRTGSEFMKSKHGADPSGLVFDALQAAKARNVDVVFIDTAGRLQTKTSLMEELGKVSRVATKVIPGAPHETLLVLDATTGQNAVSQVKAFSAAVPVTGLVMTKLDGTAKGGVLITIRDQFDIPVTLIGVGEGADDLRDFDPVPFTEALFEGKG